MSGSPLLQGTHLVDEDSMRTVPVPVLVVGGSAGLLEAHDDVLGPHLNVFVAPGALVELAAHRKRDLKRPTVEIDADEV